MAITYLSHCAKADIHVLVHHDIICGNDQKDATV